MKNVKILGTGCRNCQTTLNLVAEVARVRGVEIALEKVDRIEDIMSYRIMATPGVVIDGQIVHAGGVPDRKKVEGWFGQAT
ncbi:thioredoxin family protein [uncultured Thiocystis sp.]|jgi:small redox-active disulfide protein 2|uniref:thioredoxin family protein n=1 Tax=uncultured Thiocystis sp. TaxID=1202134 RepID=UPI0025F4FAD5|nr:thioredoxin family protein [uncultured Thiocystis sp.]